jgi:hypothetical protein
VTERPADRKSRAAVTHTHNLNFSGEKKVVQLGQNTSGLRIYSIALRHKIKLHSVISILTSVWALNAGDTLESHYQLHTGAHPEFFT